MAPIDPPMKQPIHPAPSQPPPFALSLSKGDGVDWASTSSARTGLGVARMAAGSARTGVGAAKQAVNLITPFALSLSKGDGVDWASISSARTGVGSAQTALGSRVFNLDARSLLTRGRRRALLLGKSIWQHLPPRSAPAMHVFVAGMQRSGTNMVMDVLERSPRTDVYHENDPRAFERFEMREEAVIRGLVTRSRAPFFVIKALCELDRLPALMDSFAPARTLWVLRDFEDVVNSATRSFRNFPAQLARLVQDRNSNQWRGRGMSDHTHARLQALFHEEMNEDTAAALTWYYRNILFFERKLDRDPRVLLVSYEKLVTDPEAQFQRIFEFLEIPYTPWISRIVFASSIRRRPPPPIEPGVRALCEDLTLRFQRCLEGNQDHG